MSSNCGREWSASGGRVFWYMRIAFTVGVGLGWVSAAGAAEEIVYPQQNADGTFVDGGSYGNFDGVPDDWDWIFNGTNYDGTITRNVVPGSSVEHRCFWEYNLANVTLEPPLAATLTFTVRGVPTYPFPDSEVHVYSYPSDLAATVTDYSAGPTVLQGVAIVVAYQPPTVYTLDVTEVVNEALLSGDNKVAFRFQMDPDSPSITAQGFIDALDEDVTTKPFLTLDDSVPGDIDDDGDVDVYDYAEFAACMDGPGVEVAPECDGVDFDGDLDVDLRDFRAFQTYFTGSY